jgi:predicted fused transcriptional regulator/phosphomethylpyrimidine kinase
MVRIERLKAREVVLAVMRQAMDRLLAQPLGRLIPEIRSNLGLCRAGRDRTGGRGGRAGNGSARSDRA